MIIISLVVWRQCEKKSTSISGSAAFLHTVLGSLKQSKLEFSNPKSTFVLIHLLEIDCTRSLSDIIFAKRG